MTILRGGSLVDHDLPPDLRLVLPAAASWAVAFVALAAAPLLAFGVAGALLLAGAGALRRRPRFAPAVAAALLLAAAPPPAAGRRVQGLAQGPVPVLAEQGASVRVELVVTGDPERLPPRARGPTGGSDLAVLRGRVESVDARGRTTRVRSPVLILGDERWLRLVPGTRVAAAGRLDPPRGVEPIAAVLAADDGPTVLAGPGVVQRVTERARSGLRDSVSGLPPAERGLVPGLVVGDTSGMPSDVEDDFRAAGLAHLTAVSGANLAILLAAVLGTARWAGLPARAAPFVGAVVVVGFVALARPQPSVLRAAVMGLVALAALATGRSRRALPALCAAVIALIVIDPWLARAPGFALSVVATAGLVLLAPGWRDALARRLPPPLADVLAVALAAQVMCAPIVVLLGGELSLVAIPANVLVAPAIAPATVLGVLAAIAALAAPNVAAVFGWLSGIPAWWIVQVAERAANQMGGAFGWPSGVFGAALLMAALPVAIFALRAAAVRRPLLFGALAAVVVVAATPARLVPGWPPAGWLFVACEVGQGDALVLSAGPATAVVVDAGPDPGRVNRCLRALGVRRVPLVLLTHFHADHTVGLPGVLRGRTTGAIEVSPLDEPYEQARRVRRWAAEAGVGVTRAVAGQQRSVGPLQWRTLWPQGSLPKEGSAPNNASVVIHAQRDGVDFLLTGDVEPGAQRAIRRILPAGGVDVLKVAHHGSRFQDPELLAELRPRLAVVSVGADNDYGHPARPTLELLASGGARVVRTDLDGDIAVVKSSGDLQVVRRGAATDEADRALGAGASPRAPPLAGGRAGRRRHRSARRAMLAPWPQTFPCSRR